jgi:hypothetical protein
MRNWFWLLAVLLTSCSGGDLPKYSLLDRFRILALVVDQPEIQNPAAGVVNVLLDPYLSDLKGTGDISLEVQSCLDPGVARGAQPSCEGASFASAVQTVNMTSAGGAPVGTFGDPERTGKPASGSITVGLQIPAGILATYRADIQLNGFSYLIMVKATRGADTIVGFRRVLISNKTPNANPGIADLLANGVSLTSFPSDDVELGFTSASAPESYPFMNTALESKTLLEQFQLTWFVSDGEIQLARIGESETATWKPGAAPSGRQTVVVGVLRDGRGGENVLIRRF